MFGAARGGLTVLLVIGAAVYFSGAGSWVLKNINGLNASCYSGLSRLGPELANPVCGALAKGMEAIDAAATTVGARIDAWQQGLLGNDGLGKLSSLAASMSSGISGLSSSGNDLARLISAGPSAGVQSPFQQAIDSFTIGQDFLKQGGDASKALPWLQQGAQQPQGFGLMSQLSLGNLYANGGYGVAADPQRAQFYLDQAQRSISVLSASNSSQSQQLLGTLPGSPEKIQADIQRAMLQIQGKRI